jgi:hypothetical protein
MQAPPDGGGAQCVMAGIARESAARALCPLYGERRAPAVRGDMVCLHIGPKGVSPWPGPGRPYNLVTTNGRTARLVRVPTARPHSTTAAAAIFMAVSFTAFKSNFPLPR